MSPHVHEVITALSLATSLVVGAFALHSASLLQKARKDLMSITAPSAAAQAIIDKLTDANSSLVSANTNLAAALAAAAGSGSDEQAAFDLNAISDKAGSLSTSAVALSDAINAALPKPPAPPAAFAITTTSLPDGAVGQPYSQQLAVEGGADPITFAANALPEWLTLDSSGLLSATALPVAGQFQFTVEADDGSTPPVAAAPVTLTLTVA